MKTTPILIAVALVLPLAPLFAVAQSQVAPSVTPAAGPGFQLPNVEGSLQYAVSASESATTGYYNHGDPTESTSVSGDIAYLSQSRKYPFSAVYSGALLAGTNGQPFSVVQNLALSQVILARTWQMTIVDQVSYLPETPTVGLSGVAGQGDLGVDPVQVGPITGQGILTDYANRVTNNTTASLSHGLGRRASVEASGSYGIQRFTDAPASAGLLDSNQTVASAGANIQINAFSTAGANYTYSHVSYTGAGRSSIEVQGINGRYARRWGRRLGLDASLGPQWIKLGGPAASGRTLTNLAADIVATLSERSTTGSVSYVRGTNSGFGIVQGSFSDSVNSNLRRTFGRAWSGAATVNYTRGSALASLGLPSFTTNTFVAGLQGSRGISRALSMYLSYNVQHQSTAGDILASDTFRGLSQVVALGVTYAPRPLSFGPH